jgi:hypothetical protein
MYDPLRRTPIFGEAIKEYAKEVSPQGAGKLTAQSLGVLIHVANQILRVNSAMLKLQGEQLALQSGKEKRASSQYLLQNESLSKAFKDTKPIAPPSLHHGCQMNASVFAIFKRNAWFGIP